MSFSRTEAAISEVAANLKVGMGGHIEERVRSGVPGLAVGEVPFNPVIHDPEAIKPFSFMEEVVGGPHVDQVLPKRPTEVTLINDYGNRTDIDAISSSKRRAALAIAVGLESALGVGDKLYRYATGVDGLVPADIGDIELESLENSEEYRAQSVAMRCMGGLALVLSDFHKLPLHEVQADYSSTLAIKLNHPLERRIPANVGVIGLGGDLEIDTDKPKNLAKANEMLDARHNLVVDRLQSAGMTVVSLVSLPSSEAGIDLNIADDVIAQGVNTLTLN